MAKKPTGTKTSATATHSNGSPPATQDEDIRAELERVKKENEELRKQSTERPLDLRVSPKGAISLYGLYRFPVTLYAQQWEVILDGADEIRNFIEVNKKKLAVKQERTAPEVQPIR